jgi:hypothetical protein
MDNNDDGIDDDSMTAYFLKLKSYSTLMNGCGVDMTLPAYPTQFWSGNAM